MGFHFFMFTFDHAVPDLSSSSRYGLAGGFTDRDNAPQAVGRGRLGTDVELRCSETGKDWCRLSVGSYHTRRKR
jgi:hypothetical protein